MMMDIDWSKAPEWATMYGLAGCAEIPVWFNLKQYRHVQGPQSHKVFLFDNGGSYDLHKVAAKGFRPTNPAAPEWDGELPPVGVECEMKHPGSGGWVKVEEVIAYYETEWAGSGSAVLLRCRSLFSDLEDSIAPVNIDHDIEFRPLRTKEQRQREELIELIGKQRPTIAELADAILSRYNLEPKP